MAIAYDTGGYTEDSATSSLTISNFTPNSGSNNVLVVITHADDSTDADRPVTGVTWNSTETFSQAESGNDNTLNMTTEIWVLENPTITTADIDVSFTGTCSYVSCAVIHYTGVDQTNPTDAVNNGSGSSTTQS